MARQGTQTHHRRIPGADATVCHAPSLRMCNIDPWIAARDPRSLPMIFKKPLASAPAVRRRSLMAALLGGVASSALAQFRVEVSGIGLTQVPIALAPLRGEGAAPQAISAIVRADLERSGVFRGVEAGGDAMDETTRPDMSVWRQRGADALAGGSMQRLADGRWDVRFRLWDVVRDQDLGGEGWVVPEADLRLSAHKIADYIYQKLTGEQGAFSTRLAYVTKGGKQYRLWVADADGENARPALTSTEPIISPAWSPDGRQLAYVSFEARKPVIYVHDVATGHRRLLANFRGSNSAPAWSPDGRTLAVTLSRDGGSQLYLIAAAGGEPRRLTQSQSIDTEPVFSPDGQSLYFVSDRGGAPQIYRMAIGGGAAQRVSFSGNYNVSPAISPDGRSMAFIARSGGAFRLNVMDLASGNVAAITDTSDDESPGFAPNGRLIVYATRQGGRDVLMTTTLDGRVKARLAGAGSDIREPAWGPFGR